MNNETILEVTEKVELAIITMSDKLGIATDKFYPVIVKQMYLNGIIGISIGTILTIIGGALVIIGWKEHKDNRDPFGWLFFGICTFIAGCIIIGSFILNIANPEYYAFITITDLIK